MRTRALRSFLRPCRALYERTETWVLAKTLASDATDDEIEQAGQALLDNIEYFGHY
jgi:hypothetical protein